MSATPANFDHQLAAALNESAEELYEMAPCGYLTTTIDGRIVKVNRTFTEWLGYAPDELTCGMRFIDLLTVGGRIFYETHFNLLLRMQQSVDEIALDILCRNGRILPVLINAKQKRTPDNEPVLNRFTIFNSSERRMYERQLLAARDLYQTTLASIGDGVVTTDVEGCLTFLNPVAEGLTGWTNDSAAGKPIDEVMILRREVSCAKVASPLIRALQDGVVVGLENHTILIARDGKEIPIDDSASPIRDANGNIVGGVLVFRDITTHRRAEKALQNAHELLKTRADELRRSNEDLSQFAHIASHDLRSPLNTVVQFAQLLELRCGEQLGENRPYLDFLITAAQRMRRLIEDLLSYASIAGEDSLPTPPTDSNAIIETVIENLEGTIKESGATVTHDLLPVVAIDETHLGQLFQNLIANAIHYRSQDAPRIHISAMVQQREWLFSCKDNGMGIDPAYHLQIFGAFKRLHGMDRPGSGIGLAVCKRIVERFKGRIWVESEIGRGSTFFFTLPATY